MAEASGMAWHWLDVAGDCITCLVLFRIGIGLYRFCAPATAFRGDKWLFPGRSKAKSGGESPRSHIMQDNAQRRRQADEGDEALHRDRIIDCEGERWLDLDGNSPFDLDAKKPCDPRHACSWH